MTNKSKLLDSAVVEIATRELKKLGSYGYVSKKLQAVIAASKHGITEVAKVYDISRVTLTAWIKHIKAKEIERLSAPEERRKPNKLKSYQIEEIMAWVESEPNITIEALRIRIEKEQGVVLGKSTVHRIMKKLNFSYITPRPKHYKQDPNHASEFKKKSTGENKSI